MNCIANSENNITVLHDDAKKVINLTLRYINSDLNIDRNFNFQRQSCEKAENVLNRIRCNITKMIEKKCKKMKDKISEVSVNLISKGNGEVIDLHNKTCSDVFLSADYYLKIEKINYDIDINPPYITTLELPKKNIMAGFLLYPSKLEVVNCDIKDILFKWYRTKEKFEKYQSSFQVKDFTWEEIGEGFKICTSEADVSSLLRVVGIPHRGSNKGPESEVISCTIISPGPGACPFERRHKLTNEVLNENFLRVLCYNTLADLYADSDHSRNILHPNCPPYALDIEYRKQLLIKEILGYNADLVCLQEVDEKIFLRDFQPVFLDSGLEGVFKTKGVSSVSEGLATFYRSDKLIKKEVCNFLLSQQLAINPLFEDLLEKVKQNQDLFESVNKRTTILQVCVFARAASPSQILVVGGTHLYFDPISDHIRILQAGMCLTLLRHIIDLQKAQFSTEDVSLVFCGDFNSAPENAVYRFMTSQLVDEDDPDWSSKLSEEVKNVSFSHDLEIESACGTPRYTNYTTGFIGCLDYIFYQSDKFSVQQVIPMPTQDEVVEFVAIPSVVFPSDHIALVADLKWKKEA